MRFGLSRCRQGQKLRIVGVKMAIRNHIRQTLKVIAGMVYAALRHSHALVLLVYTKQRVWLRLKEIGQIFIENHGDAGQVAERGHHSARLKLRQKARRQPRMPAQLHQAHRPLQPQTLNALADAPFRDEGFGCRGINFIFYLRLWLNRGGVLFHRRAFHRYQANLTPCFVLDASFQLHAQMPQYSFASMNRIFAPSHAARGREPFSGFAGMLVTLPFLVMMAGCGMVAAPQPPSLKLPKPVTNLTARRIGNSVELLWTMPKRTTDNVLLDGGQKARICRSLGAEPCVAVGLPVFAPEAAAEFTDVLPAPLVSGLPRELVYTVELENHAGRTAGPSNPAVSAAGQAPPQIENLQARAQANGILLSWTPLGGEWTVRMQRVLQQPASAKKQPNPQQTLAFTGKDQGQVLDEDAALDHVYTYTLQRVRQVDVAGHIVELASAPSAPVTINAKDIFPPPVPAGLQAVADTETHAIDLSWQPDTTADLAGYLVYRREAGASGPPVRISAKLDPAPSFQDTQALPGRTYLYSVSAIDQDGNESTRSAEVQESLPAQQ